MPSYEVVERKIDEIEAELKGLGRWGGRPPDSAFENMGPFGMKTMAPEQWIQWVLIPRVREIIETKGEFPSTSEVSVWAVRNFDGDEDAGRLCMLLAQLDCLF